LAYKIPPGNGKGKPELNVTPTALGACPKYQLLNSLWEKPRKGRKMIRTVRSLGFI
jgi:hypothetical protein